VTRGDWGEVAGAVTRQFGVCFAVLNMANAHVPGGAYVEGASAQEANMFRRTDCHFAIDATEYDPLTERYSPEMTMLISGSRGEVYLDTAMPRVCIRGPEDVIVFAIHAPGYGPDNYLPFKAAFGAA